MVASHDRPYPLDALAARLLAYRPPSLSALLAHLADLESYHDFLLLVEEYLPEHLEEVKRLPDSGNRIAHFARHFKDRYFPLTFDGEWVDHDAEYSQLLGHIPIPYGGIDSEDLHEVESWKTGLLLMGSLHVVQQFRDWGEGMAVVWIEACADHVDRNVLMRLPADGWSGNELHELLDGTNYEAAAHFADYLQNDTRNAFLDAHFEYPFEDAWDMETVKILTVDWQRSQVIWDQFSRLSDWLEEDPTPHYTQMLEFIFQREAEASAPRDPRTLAETYSDLEEKI